MSKGVCIMEVPWVSTRHVELIIITFFLLLNFSTESLMKKNEVIVAGNGVSWN
jgi:hypothetical protein